MKRLENKWGFGWYQTCIGHYYWHGCQIREYCHGQQKGKQHPNVVKEATTPPISEKKKIDAVKKTEK